MPKAAIFSLLPVKPNSTVASTRIGVWLRDTLGIPLYDKADIADQNAEVLIIINGGTLFCKCLPAIAAAVRTAKTVVWVQNDYTLPPPLPVSDAQSPFRKAFAERGLVPHYWTTCLENSKKTEYSASVNWNVLGFDQNQELSMLEGDKWFYYGAYRVNRELSFSWVDDQVSSWDVSSTSAKFDDYERTRRMPPMNRDNFYDTLRSYGMGVYMQDGKSANKSHSPATRFYEMLSAGLPMAFTPDCVPTLAQYDIDVRPYILHESLMDARHEIAYTQHESWYLPYVWLLEDKVKQLAKELGL